MKTRIEIKGENHNEVRAFANILLTLIENNPAEYDSIVRVDDSTSFNQLTATFVAYQADRTEVDIKGLIAKAKETADAEEKEYDEIRINAIDDYCEDTDEYVTRDENETFTIEESRNDWEIFSNVFGDDEPAQTYRKSDYSLKEAIADYKENGIY
jgi:hypothetical protein